MKTIAFATAALGLAAITTPAFAGDRDVPVEKFSIADINLETPSGQKVLDNRIDRAAKNVCRLTDVRTGTRMKSPEMRACYAKAKASAKQQVATIIEDQRRGG